MPSSDKEPIQSTLLIFLKAPQIGHVKTRLALSIGSKSALKVYRKLVDRQLTVLSPDDLVEIHFAPADALNSMQEWLGKDYSFYPQCEGELGLRLENAVSDAFSRGAKSVICIGGDCPELNRTHLEQTSAALQGDHDVVFGPSEDGGYYLIGLNAPHVELFKGIPWSAPDTLEASLEKASTLDLRVNLLETLYDIDEITELNKAVREGLLQYDQDLSH